MHVAGGRARAESFCCQDPTTTSNGTRAIYFAASYLYRPGPDLVRAVTVESMRWHCRDALEGDKTKRRLPARPTLSQRNLEPFQSQFALTMSSPRDLYSIDSDMLFEAKNNCSMASKNALGCQCQGQGREGGARSTPLMLGSWPAVGRRVSCLSLGCGRRRGGGRILFGIPTPPPKRPSLLDHSRFGAYPRSSRILLSVEPRIEGGR